MEVEVDAKSGGIEAGARLEKSREDQQQGNITSDVTRSVRKPAIASACSSRVAMASLRRLSDVQVLLLAAQLVSDVNVDGLRILAAERSDVLTQDIIYQLLLTLYPTDETSRSALLTLLRSIRTEFDDVSSIDGPVDDAAVTSLSDQVAISEAQHLHLSALPDNSSYPDASLFSRFLILWARQLECAGGSLDAISGLLQEFGDTDDTVSHWTRTYLIPLLRLQYEYYPEDDEVITLQELEQCAGQVGVRSLLRHAEKQSSRGEIARDLENVVGPWIAGSSVTKHTASWSDVYAWILAVCRNDFKLATAAFLTWNGPESTSGADLRLLGQVGFALVYGAQSENSDTLDVLQEIWARATSLAGQVPIELKMNEPAIGEEVLSMSGVSTVNLLHNNLLLQNNELTKVSQASSNLLAGILKTSEILSTYKLDRSIPSIAKTCLGASLEHQRQELSTFLQQVPRLTNAELDWHLVRHQLMWLHTWQSPAGRSSPQRPTISYLGQVSPHEIDKQLLDAILASGQYQAVTQIYLSSETSSLDRTEIEQGIISAIYAAYDNSSNGNRNRGGIKKASDALTAFRSSFPQSQEFEAISHLLRATHRLSFYQLVLQHGVPFRPVNIRAQKDPLDLIAKVLEQDPVTYSKLDDLIEVGRDLALSRAPVETADLGVSLEGKVLETEQRVTFMAVSSALANHDFDTAYSYISTRLLTRRNNSTPDSTVDDTSWRAAYAAGRYRPPSSPQALHVRISDLSKRMELLSLALTLTPNVEAIAEILGTWRRCEEEMEGLRSTALQEERAFETGDEQDLPGGFGLDEREWDAAETKQALSKRSLTTRSATYEEQAPMGLFEIARGAATSLRKNAFPLHSGGQDLKIQPRLSQSLDDGENFTQEGDRVRKRDMVSNMVTSGLVSGMGWVLGAQATGRPEQQDER